MEVMENTLTGRQHVTCFQQSRWLNAPHTVLILFSCLLILNLCASSNAEELSCGGKQSLSHPSNPEEPGLATCCNDPLNPNQLCVYTETRAAENRLKELCSVSNLISTLPQLSHLTRWFAEVMRGHHAAQMCFREKCKAHIQRQLEIGESSPVVDHTCSAEPTLTSLSLSVDKVTTDEELEEMLHRDKLSIFISDVSVMSVVPPADLWLSCDAVVLSQVDSDTRLSSQALSEIQSRHQDIVCLEASIKELHDIFTDTAVLLESQVRGAPVVRASVT